MSDFSIEGTITADGEEAIGKLDEVNESLDTLDSDFDTFEGELDAENEGALGSIDEVETELDGIDGQVAEAEIDVDTSSAEESISGLESIIGLAVGGMTASVVGGMSQQVDAIAKQSVAFDISIEALQGASFAAGQMGVSQAELTKAYNKTSTLIATQEEALNSVGIATTDVNGEMLSTADVMKGLIRDWDDLTANEEANKVLMEFLGPKVYGTFNKLTAAGSENLKELNDTFIENNAITAEQAAVYESFNDMMDLLGKTVQSIIIQAFIPFMELLLFLVGVVVSVIETVRDFINQFELLAAIIQKIINILLIAGAAFIAYGFIMSAVSIITKVMGGFTKATALATSIYTGIVWLLIAAKTALLVIMKFLAKNPWTIVLAIIIGLVIWLLRNTELLNVVLSILSVIVEALSIVFQVLAQVLFFLLELIMIPLEIIINLIVLQIKAWISVIKMLADIIITILQPPLEWLLGIFNSILDIINKVINAFKSLGSGIKNFFGGIFGGSSGSSSSSSSSSNSLKGIGAVNSVNGILPNNNNAINNIITNNNQVTISGVKNMSVAERLKVAHQQNRDMFKSVRGTI